METNSTSGGLTKIELHVFMLESFIGPAHKKKKADKL